LQGPRPAVIAWYGDHQPPFATAPNLANSMRPLVEAAPPRYLTWYEISSNLPGAASRLTAPVDIAFLPGLITQVAGIPLDEWTAANVVAREACGGLLTECRVPQVRDAYLSYLWSDLKAFDLP
jgi:hypothetical protein